MWAGLKSTWPLEWLCKVLYERFCYAAKNIRVAWNVTSSTWCRTYAGFDRNVSIECEKLGEIECHRTKNSGSFYTIPTCRGSEPLGRILSESHGILWSSTTTNLDNCSGGFVSGSLYIPFVVSITPVRIRHQYVLWAHVNLFDFEVVCKSQKCIFTFKTKLW